MILIAKSASRSAYRSVFAALLAVGISVPALVGFSAVALADDAPVAAQQAPGAHRGTPVTTTGEVARYVVSPLGHVSGFVLKDGTGVLVHGADGDRLASQVPVGQTVRVEGFAPASGGKEVFHAAVYGQHGQIVTPPARGANHGDRDARKAEWQQRRAEIAKLPAASANGTVASVLTGRHGKPRALVLTDGTSVFLSPRLAKEVASRGVKVGDRIQSSGKGATYPQGASVVVRSITFGDGAHFEVTGHGRAPTQQPAAQPT